MLLRPHTMPGGKLHSPIWTLYALYGTVDYIYGWPAWDNHVGFSAAQASLNALETIMYIYYLTVVIKSGAEKYFRAQSIDEFFLGSSENTVSGPGVARAVLMLFSTAVMTLSKTVLYCEQPLTAFPERIETDRLLQIGLNEYFGGFANIGHNTPYRLIMLWIIPNGLWLLFPTYMIYVLGKEILANMDRADHDKED